jgi:dihydroxy-acid dehydratase
VASEAAEGGTIALVQDGDRNSIDIPKRWINLDVREEGEPRRRRWRSSSAVTRLAAPKRSTAHEPYAALTTGAAYGAVREVSRR